VEFGDLIKLTDLTLFLISLDTSIGNNINNVNPNSCQAKLGLDQRVDTLNSGVKRVRQKIDPLSAYFMTGMDTLIAEFHPPSEESSFCALKRQPAVKAVYPALFRVLFILAGFSILISLSVQAIAEQALLETKKGAIVLDPGHGGSDSGAVGPAGTTEKAVALTMAQMIAAELAGEFTVEFTRLDDYQVEIEKRTAIANHQKADLFISIHAGGSFIPSATGPILYYHQNISDPYLSRWENDPLSTKDPQAPIPWDLAQYPHLDDSRLLATRIKARIDETNPIKPCRLQGAPLALLKGANMPAILIEIGYLTNPSEEKNLQNPSYLMQIAKAIASGVQDFLSQKHR
jgi:N-acetylmuramoyl-L-alanine amidase